MKKSLNELQKNICTFRDCSHILSEQVNSFIQNAAVALAVGGRGQRIQALTGDKNKNVLRVGNDQDTLVERIIKMYRDAGIKRFIALVYTHADSIIDVLGDGSAYGVQILYSHDPGKPVGRGGAIHNALLNNSILEDQHLIVHNPDDQIVNHDTFVTDIVTGHLAGVEQGHISTAIVTTTTPYSYTGMKIDQGRVQDIEMYPQIPVPAHIGVTIFDKSVYPLFKELFDLNQKTDFEKVLFPYLSERKKLYAHGIQNNQWIPVNDPKGFEQLKKQLEL